MFIDYTKVKVKAGKGGNGCISFRREKYVPRGGPSGGDGGNGGNVIIKVDTNKNTLFEYRYKKFFKATNGKHGEGSNKKGKQGKDIILIVPPGTIIKDEEDNLIADLCNEDTFILAKGGRGGRGHRSFVSSTNQAPTHAEEGKSGEERTVILELKLIADVGITGYPNAGKSTLLSVISAAKPKIADYPFSTLHPSLGVVQVDEFTTFVAADISGIIEGSHEGLGLGLQFLRHIERTRLLWILIDVSLNQDPVKTLKSLRNELNNYSSVLAKKPFLVVGSKIDAVDAKVERKLKNHCKKYNIPYFAISAATHEGLKIIINHSYLFLNNKEEKGNTCALAL